MEIKENALKQVAYTRRLIEDTRGAIIQSMLHQSVASIQLVTSGIDASLQCLDIVEKGVKKV